MSEIEIAEGVQLLPRDEWNALVGDESPFLEWEWLASLEEAGCVGGRSGWQARPLVAFEEGKLIAACPMYVKFNSEGEFVHDWSWADSAQRAGISYYPKLLVGIPFTPVTGARFLIAEGLDREAWRSRFIRFLREICSGNDFSGVHVNFCRKEELENLSAEGFLPRVGFQYHWQNHGYGDFEDYLARFRSKKRNQIRRERRELENQGIELEFAVGDEVDEARMAHQYRFYLSTIENHHYYGRQYLNEEFFALITERFRHRIQLTQARRGDDVVAGTLNVFKGKTLYGRYWGTDRPLKHLHFNTCYYAPIEFCIQHGLDRFEPGAGGEYKQVRGFDAEPTVSGHFLSDPRLSNAIGSFLERERVDAADTIEWFRDRSALKKQSEEET
jgi:predicted N-acyltransferase